MWLGVSVLFGVVCGALGKRVALTTWVRRTV